MKKLLFIILILLSWAQNAGATAYYVSFQTGIANGDGLATTTPFNNLDSFTEVARSAGDIAFVRRGFASTTNNSNLTFTSDGTSANPIIISADYDNLWSDFATSSQTYTVNTATSTLYASASITGIAAGDWIYVAGDCSETYNASSFNNCEFAYEVASVSGNALNLYMPYKGNQSGAGLSLRVMPDNPQWQTTAGGLNWIMTSTSGWVVKGMDIRSTNGACNIQNATTYDNQIVQTILQGNGTTDCGISVDTNSATKIFLYNVRFFGFVNGMFLATGSDGTHIEIYNSLFDCNSVGTSDGINSNGVGGNIYIYDTEFKRCSSNAVQLSTVASEGMDLYGRNVKINSITTPWGGVNALSRIYLEDFQNEIGKNKYSNSYSIDSNLNTLLQSTTTVTRSGGGSSSIHVIPSTSLGSINNFSAIRLFEYPIYANTSSKQYDMYFMSTSTAAWTADPTASELWIECEYWAHGTGATTTRKIKKSTGVIDFNGSTAWQNLSVTCQPSNAGILYLQGWYRKTKESGKMNEFFVDVRPVVQ